MSATAISFGIAGLMVVWYFVFMPRTLRLYRLKATMKSLRLTLRNLGYQMKMGFSAMLGEIAVCGAVITGNFVFAHYLGDAGVAGIWTAIPFSEFLTFVIILCSKGGHGTRERG